MSKKLEFDCTGDGDRIDANDAMQYAIQKMRKSKYRMSIETFPDGTFEMRVVTEAAKPVAKQSEADEEIPADSPKSRARKNKPEPSDVGSQADASVQPAA